jgi:hypothetical protein
VTMKLRSTRSGAGCALPSRTVVVNHLRRLAPYSSAAFIKRAIRLRPTWRPAANSPRESAAHYRLRAWS